MRNIKSIKQKSITLEEGIRLKVPSNSPNYQYYFKMGGVTHRKTCGTRNQRTAEDIARKAYKKCAYEQENGIISKSTSFTRLTKQYLRTIEGQGKYTFQEGTIRRHFIPFFSKFNDISRIKLRDIEEYVVCRQSKPVTNSTLNKERCVFNQLMQYALKHDYISNTKIKIDRFKETPNPRPYFDKEQ